MKAIATFFLATHPFRLCDHGHGENQYDQA